MALSYEGSIVSAREEPKEIIVKCKFAAGNSSKAKTDLLRYCKCYFHYMPKINRLSKISKRLLTRSVVCFKQ
jgi:hypothetical protein